MQLLTKSTLSVISREGLTRELSIRAPALIIGLCGLTEGGRGLSENAHTDTHT